MSQVRGSIKENKTIARFDFDTPTGVNQPLRFNNIEEAKPSPLAQKMFYLPFVKSVVLYDKAIEILKFDILEWEDVLSEVAQEIETFLSSAEAPYKAPEVTQKIPVTVYAESTPNPGVMKFVANKPLVDQIQEFKNIDDTADAPLAQALFHFPFVKEVFMDKNYISITKFDITEWEEVVMEVREFLRSYIEDGKAIINLIQESKAEASQKKQEALEGTAKEIVDIIEEYIQPAVASDGGNILFDSYDENEKSVKVILQGACSRCPSSTLTLKSGIENMLKEMLPGKVATVSAING